MQQQQHFLMHDYIASFVSTQWSKMITADRCMAKYVTLAHAVLAPQNLENEFHWYCGHVPGGLTDATHSLYK